MPARRSALRFLRVIIPFAMALCAGAQTPATGNIEGRVFNAATGAALGNARV